MTLDKATEMLKVQAGFGGFYNANSAKLILAEASRKHGQARVLKVGSLSGNEYRTAFDICQRYRTFASVIFVIC